MVRVCCVVGCLAGLVADRAAEAADFKPVVVQNPQFDWSGWYVGGHVGYSRGYGRNTLSDPGPTDAGASFGSLFGGLQFGYNYLLPSRLLLGMEADISFPNFLDDGIVASRPTPTSTVTEKLDFVSTVRGRVGFAFDHWLVYATGGLAWSQARLLEDPGVTSDEDKVLRMRAGWALGTGAELAVAPGWTARLEYLYDYLGKASGTFPSGTGYESTTVYLHSLRLGLNRKLDWTGTTTDSGNITPAWAADANSWNVHGQFTYVEQGYPAFHSPYQGANSLSAASQAQGTASATAFVGFRPWDTPKSTSIRNSCRALVSATHWESQAFPTEKRKNRTSRRRVSMSRVFSCARHSASAASRKRSKTARTSLAASRIFRGSPSRPESSLSRTSSM